CAGRASNPALPPVSRREQRRPRRSVPSRRADVGAAGASARRRARHRVERTAALLVLPFVLIYGALFLYPSAQMVLMSFTDGQLIVPGEWVGLENYIDLFTDRRFGTAIVNTTAFVLMTVVPGTII